MFIDSEDYHVVAGQECCLGNIPVLQKSLPGLRSINIVLLTEHFG